MAKERVHVLSVPVMFGKEEITEVTIARKLRHLRSCSIKAGADGNGGVSINIEFGTLIDLGSKMIGHTPAVLEDMAEEDQQVILKEANDFLLSALGTGPAP